MTPTFPKFCMDCKNSTYAPGQPQYRRCTKAADPNSDAGLCASMRRSTCGKDATLFEAKD